MSNANSWFSMRASGTTADVSIYSDIGDWGLSAADFSKQLKSLGRPNRLNINITSNGGDVSTGFSIFNMLASHPAHKVVTISGLAASMASVIAMAGDEILMPANSILMVHNPWGSAMGESDSIISFGEALAKMRNSIASAYVARSGMSLDEVFALMDAETWLGAEEAVALGLADRVIEPQQMAALIDTNKFQNVPVALREITANWKPRTLDEVRIKAFQKYNRRGPT